MRLRTLNGAPLCEALDFSSDTLLDASQRDLAFEAFVTGQTPHSTTAEDNEFTLVKWRRIEANPNRLRSAWSQPYIPVGGIYESKPSLSYSVLNAGALTNATWEASGLDDTSHTFEEYSSGASEFLHQSLVLHDTLLSSQIALDESREDADNADDTVRSSSFLSTSFGTTATDPSEEDSRESQGPVLELPPKLAITSMANLPSAMHLRAIYPQTPTPTFICGLTADVDRREVFVKKGNYKMHLYELTVADETSSGFKVSFWFRPARTQDRAQEALRDCIEELKTGDVVLLRNIVLTIFRDRVFGQSLSPKISKARTSIEILTKANGSRGFKHVLPVAADEKFVRVKKWTKANVVTRYGDPRKRKGAFNADAKSFKRATRFDHSLPPDTMESS